MAKENEIVIFETSDHSISLPVTLDSDTVWLNRAQMAELFGRDIKTIGKHIKNALHEELAKDSSVVAKFATTADCIFARKPGKNRRYACRDQTT